MSVAPIFERRRGDRVLIRIPIEVRMVSDKGAVPIEATETVVVSQNGALVRLNTAPKLGATLEIVNKFTQQAEKFRVAWVGKPGHDRRVEVGVEMLTLKEQFWGLHFPPRDKRP